MGKCIDSRALAITASLFFLFGCQKSSPISQVTGVHNADVDFQIKMDYVNMELKSASIGNFIQSNSIEEAVPAIMLQIDFDKREKTVFCPLANVFIFTTPEQSKPHVSILGVSENRHAELITLFIPSTIETKLWVDEMRKWIYLKNWRNNRKERILYPYS